MLFTFEVNLSVFYKNLDLYEESLQTRGIFLKLVGSLKKLLFSFIILPLLLFKRVVKNVLTLSWTEIVQTNSMLSFQVV